MIVEELICTFCLPTGNVKKASKAKVAVFSCGLDIAQTETKGTVLLKKAEELLDFSRGEEKQLEGVSLRLGGWSLPDEARWGLGLIICGIFSVRPVIVHQGGR